MSFAWNAKKKVELYNPGTRKTQLSEATPSYILHHPYGFRQEDIIHSLAIAVAELIDMSEAQATTFENILNLKEARNAKEKSEENDESKRDNDDPNDADDSRQVENSVEEGGGVVKSSGVEHSSS